MEIVYRRIRCNWFIEKGCQICSTMPRVNWIIIKGVILIKTKILIFYNMN